jgi:FG-GAP-like repeat
VRTVTHALALVLLAAVARAQCPPYALEAPRHIIPPLNRFGLIGAADFDRDGRIDIVASNALLFANGRVVPLDAPALVADVDGDGWPDILAGTGETMIRTYLNRRDGTFDITASPARGRALLATDLNRDGRIDVVLGGDGFIGLGIYLGDGKGGFTLRGEIRDKESSFFTVQAGDLDGDGKLDLVGNRFPGEIYAYPGDGSGGFGEARPVLFQGDMVGIVDVDRDGKDDLVVQTLRLLVLRGADPSAAAAIDTPVKASLWGTSAMGDVNGDGLLDVIVVAEDGLRVMVNDGRGGFAARPAIQHRTSSIVPVDANGDGDLDLITALSGEYVLFLGNGDGTFRDAPRIDAKGSPLVAGDFDGDGADDAAAIDAGTLNVVWSAAVSRALQRVAAPFDLLLAAGDADGDGRADLIGRKGGDLVIATLNRDGTTAERLRVRVPAYAAVLGPFFGSTNLGLATLHLDSTFGTVLSIYDVTVPAAPVFTSAPMKDSIRFDLLAGDLDGNGADDLVVVASGVAVSFHNFGTPEANGYVMTFFPSVGSFSSTLAYAPAHALLAPALGDLDADGALDLAFVTLRDGLNWLRNDGSGGFDVLPNYVMRVEIPFDAQLRALARDLDGDGVADLAVANGISLTLAFGSAQGPTRLARYLVPGSKHPVAVHGRGGRVASLLVSTDQLVAVLHPWCGVRKPTRRP